MGLKDYLAALMRAKLKNERELSNLSPAQESFVRTSLDKMLSFEQGGLNHELNNRALQQPTYRGDVAMSVEFFYDSNTGEMIHFGFHPELTADDLYHEGKVRVAGKPEGNRVVEIYTNPKDDSARVVIAETVNRYNRTKL
jgi:hypothetical protein